MVNANENKWEPVEAEALRLGDKVRVSHPSGDLVVGTVRVDGPHYKLAIKGSLGAEVWPHQWARGALQFERAAGAPLPDRAGLYAHVDTFASDFDWSNSYPTILFHDGRGGWTYNGHSIESDVALRDARSWHAAGNLVRLVADDETQP